jgi:predicted regulator of Ras-like GTPase activity (Roadblock/LC7/MglB family)
LRPEIKKQAQQFTIVLLKDISGRRAMGSNFEYEVKLRSGLSIFPAQDQAFDQMLSELVEKATGRFVLLADVTGQFINAKGETRKTDLIALGSLAAGDLAASTEIARLSGEYQEDQMIVREGSKYYTIIYEVGTHLLLLLQVSIEVPLGWVRILVKQYASKLKQILLSPPEKAEGILSDFLKGETQAFVDQMLDDLWGEG